MTVSSTNRKAGPYTGNDVTTAFPFSFKVFNASDLCVVRADSTGAETVLTLTAQYSVSLNADQNANPGGTINLPAALASGYTLTATSLLAYLQPIDLTNNGGFYPKVINNALDRLTIFCQQLAEQISRALKYSITSPLGDAALPAPVPNNVIGWNSAANGFQNYPPVDNTLLAAALAAPEGATLIGIKQPGTGAVGRLLSDKLAEQVSVFDFMTASEISDIQAGTAAMTVAAKINLAADYVGARGGGIVLLPAGTYSLENTNPGAASWDNKRAIYLRYSNVQLKGEGRATKLKLADGANAHTIKIGSRVTETVTVTGCAVLDLEVDGNRANQVTPDATDNHNNGIDISSGCGSVGLERLYVHDTIYYGVGFQRQTFENCTVKDVLIENTGADGLDWKDDNGDNKGNFVENLRVRNFGLVPALTQQGGFNTRGGVSASNIEVTDFSGDKHGVRFDSSSNENKPKLQNFFIKASAQDTTKGIYLNSSPLVYGGTVCGGIVLGAGIGVDANGEDCQLANITAKNCGIGFELYSKNQGANLKANSCTTGFHFINDVNVIVNASAISCVTGALIEAGADLNSIRGGVFDSNTTNVIDSGAQTAISHVSGINTHSVGTANVPIDSTGTKVVAIAHGLGFTPSLDDVVLTFKRNTNVGDFSLGFHWVYSADAANVYCNVRVLTASATAGATITMVANCMAKKALRQ